MAKRSRLEIILDILEAVRKKGGKIKPTHLMYKANLSYNQMRSYLEELIEKEVLQKVKIKGYDYIIITDHGHKFAEKLKEMKEFEEAFGL